MQTNISDQSKDGFIFFFDPQNIDGDTLIVPLFVILTEIQLLIHFSVMAALIRIAYLYFLAHQVTLKNRFIAFFDPRNMSVDTIIVTLSVVFTELQLNIQFSLMEAQISIHIVRGTFSQLVNIANRFYMVSTS